MELQADIESKLKVVFEKQSGRNWIRENETSGYTTLSRYESRADLRLRCENEADVIQR